MRDLPVLIGSREVTTQEAKTLLRRDEFLVPAGGVWQSGYPIYFYSATNEEGFQPKETRLEYRRRFRKQRREEKSCLT